MNQELKDYYSKMKSVKSINPIKSVILTKYDIVTKGHGGTISVEREGTKYIIQLPISLHAILLYHINNPH
jgi:hypothetical protein